MKRLVQGIVLVFAGAALGTLAAEVGARWYLLGPGGIWGERLNGYGFRERELAADKSSGTVRVVCLGDSFTYGSGVPARDTFVRQLERWLNASPGPRYEVLNLGKPGANALDEVEIFTRIGAPLRPDLVILHVFIGNDILDNLVDRDDDGTWLRYEPPRANPVSRALAPLARDWAGLRSMWQDPKFQRMSPPARVKEVLNDYSVAYRIALAGVEASPVLRRWGVRHGLMSDDQQQAGSASESALSLFRVDRESPDAQVAWEKMRQAIQALDEKVRAVGGRLLCVAIPVNYQVEDALWDMARRQFARPAGEYRRDAPDRTLLALCRDRGIPVADLLAPFIEASAKGTRLYRRYPDMHLSRDGHRLAAEQITALVQGHMLAAAPR